MEKDIARMGSVRLMALNTMARTFKRLGAVGEYNSITIGTDGLLVISYDETPT